MLRNYLLIAFRNLQKHRAFSVINIPDVAVSLFSVFTSVTILTSCLSLFGLSMFMSEQRTKEIGIAGVIALLTVSFQRVKAALVNPVKLLRSE